MTPVLIMLFGGFERVARAGRIALWLLLIPLLLANLPLGMDFDVDGPAWSYAVGGFRMTAFLIAFFLAKWLLVARDG